MSVSQYDGRDTRTTRPSKSRTICPKVLRRAPALKTLGNSGQARIAQKRAYRGFRG